jgi:DNA-binding CsgD family transcriptional regulator
MAADEFSFDIATSDTGVAACRPAPPQMLAQLTDVERQVLHGLCSGKTNKQIAMSQGKSAHTVRNQLHHIFVKLSVTNRAEAAARYAIALEVPTKV